MVNRVVQHHEARAEAQGGRLASSTINAGTSVSFDVDVTEHSKAWLFVTFTPANSSGTYTVQAYPKAHGLTANVPLVSNTPEVDETFSPAATTAQTEHIELPQGLFSVKLTAGTSNSTACTATLVLYR